jgi:hypothetical protein
MFLERFSLDTDFMTTEASRQPYTIPTVTDLGSIADLTQAGAPVTRADQAIPAQQPLTSSGV